MKTEIIKALWCVLLVLLWSCGDEDNRPEASAPVIIFSGNVSAMVGGPSITLTLEIMAEGRYASSQVSATEGMAEIIDEPQVGLTTGTITITFTPGSEPGSVNISLSVTDQNEKTSIRNIAVNVTGETEPLAGTWTMAQSMPTARKEIPNTVLAIGSLIYVVSGVSAGQTVGTLEVYDTETDQWNNLAEMPVAAWRASAAVHGGMIYVFGGFRGESFPFDPTRQSFRYDPVNNEWTSIANMPTARGATAAEELDDLIYVIGGAANEALSIVEIYDPVSDTWSAGPSMRTTRSGVAATVLEGKIYAFGGYNLGTGGVVRKASAEVFTPGDADWSSIGSMPIARVGQTASILAGKIYVFGGQTDSTIQSKSLEYDPVENSWTQVANMPNPVNFAGSATVGEKIYVIGGGATNLNRNDGVNSNRVFMND